MGFTRFLPSATITGKDLNLILDILDGGKFTAQGTPVVSGQNNTGSTSSGGPTGGSGGGSNPPGGTPSTPTGLGGYGGIDRLAQANDGYVNLTWNPNPSGEFVMEYDIQWRKGADTNAYVTKVGGGVYSVKIPSLFPGNTYMFSIRAVNGAGYSSPWSSEVGIGISPDVTPPAVPTGLVADSATKGVYLEWTPVSGSASDDLAGYDVAISTDGGVTFPTVNTLGPGVTYFYSYTNLNPADNQANLRFKVRSRDWTGNSSAYSSVVAATVGGLAFDELTVGTLKVKGILGALGGLQTASSGQRLELNSTGLVTYDAGNAQTASLTAATGSLQLAGNLTVSGTITGGTIVGAVIETSATALTTGGVYEDTNGIQVVSTGSFFPVGVKTWFANVNGQFLTAQYFPAFSGYMPADGSTPATFRFQVVSDVLRIIKVTFSVFVDSYKFGKQTTSATEASHTHGFSSQSTANDAHHHHITVTNPNVATDQPLYATVTGSAPWVSSNQTGQIPTDTDAGHTHDLSGVTSAGGSSHSHNLNDPSVLTNISGITQISTVKIYNPSGVLVATLGPYNLSTGQSQNDVDITSYLRNADWTPVATGWWQVYIQANGLGAVQAQVNVKATIQAI